jgi:hypothetical protein
MFLKSLHDIKNYYIMTLITIRNFYVKNFFVKIIGFQNITNKKCYYLSGNYIYNKLYSILRFVPFIIIIKIANIFNYEIIYKCDKIYYITNIKINKILPVLLEFKSYNSQDTNFNYNLTSIIQYYTPSLTFDLFINENIPKSHDLIKIKYIKKGIVNEKVIIINNYKNSLIYNLFED